MTILDHMGPSAQHIGDDDFPWADTGQGIRIKVLQVRESEGLWVVRNEFAPGIELQTHRHSGQVFGVTFSGRWGYRESPELNTAGSYLFEPANSVHTLYTPEDNDGPTDVVFIISGVNINLDEHGEVDSITSGASTLAGYYAMLDAAGIERPPVLID